MLLIFFFINSYKLYAQEDALTIKQQLDRIMEEVKDLNKAVFNKSFDNSQLNTITNENDTERFTSIDIRIYDLEKDIKNLTLQLEEILFRLDDLTKGMNTLEDELITNLEKIKSNVMKINNEDKKIENVENSSSEEKNTLGKIVISDNAQVTNVSDSSNQLLDNEKKELDQELSKLTPEEQLQSGIDQLRKKNYDKSKKILDNFIKNFPENQLSGSAYYWLGKIYLFEKNYREAALVFGEGVQKFPKSIKAAEMYYELARSLKEMNKIPEACKTLVLLEENYKGDIFSNDPENFKEDLNCANNN